MDHNPRFYGRGQDIYRKSNNDNNYQKQNGVAKKPRKNSQKEKFIGNRFSRLKRSKS